MIAKLIIKNINERLGTNFQLDNEENIAAVNDLLSAFGRDVENRICAVPFWDVVQHKEIAKDSYSILRQQTVIDIFNSIAKK